jgi:hypothetical protein
METALVQQAGELLVGSSGEPPFPWAGHSGLLQGCGRRPFAASVGLAGCRINSGELLFDSECANVALSDLCGFPSQDLAHPTLAKLAYFE